MPGWGTYPYSTSPWAGNPAAAGPVLISEAVPVSEVLTVSLPIRVENAVALNPYLVRLNFSHNLNYGYAPILNAANYSIVPLLGVTAVAIGPSSNSVLLTTDQHTQPIYTVTVGSALSSAGDTLDPAHRTAVFAGFGTQPTFFAAAQSRTKVQLVFSLEMEQNLAFSNISSYVLTDLNLNAIRIISTNIYGPAPVQRLTLELASEMDPGGYYVLTILSPDVKTTTGVNLTPNYDMFQWGEMQSPYRVSALNINIDRFSGEVSGGLLGQPLGQVFFSPALEAAIADSSIQIDSVSCCTRAYDVYTVPSLPDPFPLMTFGPEQTYSSVLGGNTAGNVLWAPADRLGLAHVSLADLREDTLPTAVDGPADAILQETFDQSRVSLLNVDDWVLFDGVGTSFATADNLTPIPAGTTTNVNLQP
jgi:hypothetical protein